MKPVLTAADLEKVPPGGEITITPDTIITPLAREEAERRSITLRTIASREREAAGAPPGPTEAPGESARTVAVGADHGGFELKEELKRHLRDWGYRVAKEFYGAQEIDGGPWCKIPEGKPGAGLVIKRGTKLIRPIFISMVLLLILKLIYSSYLTAPQR